MYLDKLLKVSEAQAVTASAVSTSSVDLGASRGDVAAGEVILPFAQVTTATFTTCTSIEVQLIQSAAAALTSPDVLATSGAIAVASLALGYTWKIPSPAPGAITKRYLGFNYVVAGSNAAAGTIDAFVATGVTRVSQTA